MEDSLAGRLLHARMTTTIVIQDRLHHHGFDAISGAGYPVATALGTKGVDRVSAELKPIPRKTTFGTAIRPSADFWAPIPRGRRSSADCLSKYVSHSQSREQTSGGQSDLKEASRSESPPLSLPEASVILVTQPQYDLYK